MRFHLSLIVLLTLSVNALAQKTITLDQAVKIALQTNTTLQKTTYGLQSNKASVKSSYGALLPSLSVNGGWNWNRSSGVGGEYVSSSGVLSTMPSSRDSRSFSLGYGLSWTLFDGLSNYRAVDQSKNDLESAKQSLKRVKQDIVFNTTSGYYDVLNAKQLVKVREEDLEYNKKNLEVISERNELGLVTLADVYAQQVNVGNSELALIQTVNSFETQKSQLLNYLGLDVFEDVNFDDASANDTSKIIEGTMILQEASNMSRFAGQAMQNRSDYKSAGFRLQSAQNGVDIAKSSYMPRVSASNSFSTSSDALSGLNDNRQYGVSLNISMPIFNGWSTDRNVEMAKVNVLTQEVTLTEMERQIKMDIKKTCLDFQAAQKQLEVSGKSVRSAQQNRQIEQEKYNLGAGTFVNLLLASSNYTLALQNYINTKFQFYKMKSQLEYYIGVPDYEKFE
ncbi:MAG: TolC family protein [Ignavibacteria bacterium]